jgi:hypothetical protein
MSWTIHTSLVVDAGIKHFVKTILKHHPGAQFVDKICVETRKGSGIFTDDTVMVFWQPDPPQGYHPYFVYYHRPEYPGQKEAKLYIASGESFDPEVAAIIIPNKTGKGGKLMYSRYRHDYYTLGDAMVDGGRDYLRSSLHDAVKLNIHTGIFEWGGELWQATRPPERERLRYCGMAEVDGV